MGELEENVGIGKAWLELCVTLQKSHRITLDLRVRSSALTSPEIPSTYGERRLGPSCSLEVNAL